MTVPNHIGSAIQNIGAIVVKAIVDAAGELIFQITNNGASTFQVSLREVDTGLDAATLNVAGHHTINYDPLGGINPGDVISITTQGWGWENRAWVKGYSGFFAALRFSHLNYIFPFLSYL